MGGHPGRSAQRAGHQPIRWMSQFVPDGPDIEARKLKRAHSGTANRVNSYTDKWPWLGPSVFILATFYFLAQVVVGWVWSPPYSFVNNTISDLGNSSCGIYGTSRVCSPRWLLMDVAFIFLGVVMAAGSLFIYQEFNYLDRKDPDRRAACAGFVCLAVGGVGAMLVGIFPENTVGLLHAIGAGVAIGVGNLGILLLGLVLTLPEGLRTFMRLFAVLSMTAAICFASNKYFGLGAGGMERIAAYPESVWLIVFGMYISRTHRAAI